MKKKKVTFNIHGANTFIGQELPPLVHRLKKFLDASKLGDLWGSDDVMAAIGHSPSGISSSRSPKHLPGYFVDATVACGSTFGRYTRRKRLWGSPKTIQEYKNENQNA